MEANQLWALCSGPAEAALAAEPYVKCPTCGGTGEINRFSPAWILHYEPRERLLVRWRAWVRKIRRALPIVALVVATPASGQSVVTLTGPITVALSPTLEEAYKICRRHLVTFCDGPTCFTPALADNLLPSLGSMYQWSECDEIDKRWNASEAKKKAEEERDHELVRRALEQK